MQNTDYQAFTQPTTQLVDEVLSHWQEIRGQSETSSTVVDSFEQRLLSLIARQVAVAEIGGQQVTQSGGKRQLAGQRS